MLPHATKDYGLAALTIVILFWGPCLWDPPPLSRPHLQPK